MDQVDESAVEQLLRAVMEALDRRGNYLAAAYVAMALDRVGNAKPMRHLM